MYTTIECCIKNFLFITLGKVQNMRIFIPPLLPELKVLKCDVYPSMKSNKPHSPWVFSAADGEVRTAHCTCLAG